MPNIEKIISYYSLVDKALEDQREAVEAFASAHGARIIDSYVESRARKYSWSKLSKAIERAKATGSLFVIAKLGRLEFNVAVTELLQSSQIDFWCLDKSEVTRDNIHMAAEVARDKVQKASQKKRDTFGKLKAKGVKLASACPEHWKGREHLRGWKKGAQCSGTARTERANQTYAFLIPKMQEILAEVKIKAAEMQDLADAAAREVKQQMAPKIEAARAKGDAKLLLKLIQSYRKAKKAVKKPYSYRIYWKVAEKLNEMGHQTTWGTPFNGPTVCRILQRAEGRKPKKRQPVEV
jgi:DNA invertase Pin-like site-specific DNA recombinase